MEYFKSRPFETIIFLVLFFAVFFVSDWSGPNFVFKVASFIFGLIILFIIWSVKFAFSENFERIKDILFKVIYSQNFKNMNNLTKSVRLSLVSIFIIPIITFLELFVLLVITVKIPVAVGFPFLVYSFSANKLIMAGIVLDIITYTSVMFFIFNASNENRT